MSLMIRHQPTPRSVPHIPMMDGTSMGPYYYYEIVRPMTGSVVRLRIAGL
jgi:hypothetical protein